MISDIDDKKIEVVLKKYLFSENGLHQIHPIKKMEKSFRFVFHLGLYLKFMHNVKRLEGLLSTILPFEKKNRKFFKPCLLLFCTIQFLEWGTMGPLIFSIQLITISEKLSIYHFNLGILSLIFRKQYILKT